MSFSIRVKRSGASLNSGISLCLREKKGQYFLVQTSPLTVTSLATAKTHVKWGVTLTASSIRILILGQKTVTIAIQCHCKRGGCTIKQNLL